MNFEQRAGRRVRGNDLKRGQVVRVLVGGVEMGIGIVDGMAADDVDAVWIVFYGSGPRLVAADSDSTVFDAVESKVPPGN